LVESVNELSTSIQEGFQVQATRDLLLLSLGSGNDDLKNIADNILQNEGLMDQKLRDAATKVGNAVTSAVIEHRWKQVEERVIFTQNQKRGMILTGEEEAPDDEPTYSGNWDFHGISVFKDSYRLSSEFKTQYELFSFSEKTSWYNTISSWIQTHKSKIEIRKQQEGNNLYLRAVDSEGYINGFDPDSGSKNRVVLDYAQAEYYQYLNGTEVIYLPVEEEGFTTYVWGGNMEETEESYSIRYRLIVDDIVLAEKTLENPITEYTEHSIPISFSENEITVGETSITELEVPLEEPDVETDEQESDEISNGGIPSFSILSVIIGVSLVLLLLNKRID
jgi:hypothetical protein